MRQVVDIATEGRHLSRFRGFLVVEADRAEIGRVPLSDIEAVIVHAHGLTCARQPSSEASFWTRDLSDVSFLCTPGFAT